MVHFSCPRCQTVAQGAAEAVVSCPGCGERLTVPAGEELDFDEESGFAPPPVEVRSVLGRTHLFWNCTACGDSLDVPYDPRQQAARCPHCGAKTPIPAVPQKMLPQPNADEAETEATYPLVEPVPRPRASARPSRDDEEVPRRRRRRRGPEYDDDDEDYVIRRRGRRMDLQTCTRAAASGLTFSLLGLGMLAVSFVILIAAANANPGRDRQGMLIFILFIAVAISFVLSLSGTICSSRGLNPVNGTNRGMGTAGLVCGIIGLVISAVAGILVFCIGLIVWSTLTRF